jgi:hypothetical protein
VVIVKMCLCCVGSLEVHNLERYAMLNFPRDRNHSLGLILPSKMKGLKISKEGT